MHLLLGVEWIICIHPEPFGILEILDRELHRKFWQHTRCCLSAVEAL